jgi:hypothetical protein
MQYIWMKFYGNNFVYAYFAKLRAQLTRVKPPHAAVELHSSRIWRLISLVIEVLAIFRASPVTRNRGHSEGLHGHQIHVAVRRGHLDSAFARYACSSSNCLHWSFLRLHHRLAHWCSRLSAP